MGFSKEMQEALKADAEKLSALTGDEHAVEFFDIEMPEKVMEVTNREPGYAHTRVQGTCSPDVTVEDVKRRFYHGYFGGRDAWVRDGKFGCVIHTD